MLLMTLEQAGVWELDVPLVVHHLKWFIHLIFLDMGLSILFLVLLLFFCCFCCLVVVLWLFYDWQGFIISWGFLDTNLLHAGIISLKFQNLTVCCWLVLRSKKCGYHIMEVMPEKTAYSHKNHPIFLGPTELIGEKLLGGIHGNVHWI